MKRRALLILSALAFLILMLLRPSSMMAGAKSGLTLWALTVLPSLFPFLVATSMLMYLGMDTALSRISAPLMKKAFSLPGEACAAWLPGAVGGYPVGAKITGALGFSRGRSRRLLCLCNVCSPFFLLSAVGEGLLGDIRSGALLLICLHLSAILCALAMPAAPDERPAEAAQIRRPRPANPLSAAMADSTQASLTVGGFIVFFSAVFTAAADLKVFDAVEKALLPLWLLPDSLLRPVLEGVVEITSGCEAAALAQAPYAPKMAALAFIAGWGGLSALAQAASFVGRTGVRIYDLALIGLLRGLVSGALAFFLASLLFHP